MIETQEKDDVTIPPRHMFILLTSKGVKLFEKKEETIPSPLQQFRGR